MKKVNSNKKENTKQSTNKPQQRKKGAPKWKNVQAEIENLKKRIAEEVPPSGILYYKFKQPPQSQPNPEEQNPLAPNSDNPLNPINPITTTVSNKKVMETEDKSKIKIRFSDMPISKSTTAGLYKAKFIKMTEVQRSAIPHALIGRDMVVCARTGSGKTLSYLIPVIERLFKEQFSSLDGLGALVMVPTRELAIQAFEVLRSFAGMHDLSAGLIIGGKDMKFEQERLRTMNILICTPGRLLQHMNESDTFDPTNLKIMVIDEVDRLLDMGFRDSLDQIMKNLPKQNVQTLLYSATIGKSLKEVARVNLKGSYEYICIHDYDSIESLANDYTKGANGELSKDDKAINDQLKSITPVKLLHYYMLVNLEDKLDILFSFIKSHQTSKCLIFFSSCKQVRFAYEAFKRLKLGVGLLELHGRQKQSKRTAIYFEYVERKTCVLFATDIASRGIDFPAVDWVIQYDCPEDLNTYIHRVGRTARYKSKGNALLFLTPSEQKFAETVQKRGIQLKKLAANPNRSLTIQPTLQKMNAENRDLKHLAEKACISYLKSVHLMKDKEVFNLKNVDPEKLALSLGLATSPIISFIKQDQKAKNQQRDQLDDFGDDEDDIDEIQDIKVEGKEEKVQPRMTRLQKLRLKIKAKKDQKKKDKEEAELKVAQLDSDDAEDQEEIEGNESSLENQNEDEQSEIQQNDSEEEELFVSKKDQRKFSDDEKQEQIEEAEDQQLRDKIKNELKASKKALSKITSDGPFQGKNKVFFDANGKQISSLEYHLIQEKQNAQKQQQNDVTILKENDASITQGEELDFVSKVKKSLKETEAQDKKLAKEKLTEKRLKKKRFLKKLKGIDNDDDVVEDYGQAEEEGEEENEEFQVTLKGQSDENDNGNEDQQSDENDQEEEKVQVKNKKKEKMLIRKKGNKRQRVSEDQTDLKQTSQEKSKTQTKQVLKNMSAEERAILLLSKDNDDF